MARLSAATAWLGVSFCFLPILAFTAAAAQPVPHAYAEVHAGAGRSRGPALRREGESLPIEIEGAQRGGRHAAAEALNRSSGSSKKLLGLGVVAALAASVALQVLSVRWKQAALQQARDRHAAASREVAELEEEARGVSEQVPAAIDLLLDAYEEHVLRLTKRYAEAIDRLQQCELIPYVSVGKTKAAFLKINSKVKMEHLQEEWVQVQRALDLDLSAEAGKAVEEAAAAFFRKLQELLDHPSDAYGAQLLQLRDQAVDILQHYEGDPEGLQLQGGEPADEYHVVKAQEFIHSVTLITNRQSTLKPVKKAKEVLAQVLKSYAKKAESVGKLQSLMQQLERDFPQIAAEEKEARQDKEAEEEEEDEDEDEDEDEELLKVFRGGGREEEEEEEEEKDESRRV